jgi:DNA-binding winged helix-turn-helix (wHTH) protein
VFACAVCETRTPDRVGVLCPACVASLATGERRAPNIVTSRAPVTAGWLIDVWGQLHPIPSPCRVGRDPKRSDLTIADLSISAEHAELKRTSEGWRMRDRGSSNGTSVGARVRARDASVPHRERVRFGSIAFVLWADPEPPARDVPAPSVPTVVPPGGAVRLEGPDRAIAILRAARGHTIERAPGELEIHGRKVVVPRLQFQLLRALCDAQGEYVTSHELVDTLPFQSGSPTPNHVRQVVSTLRTTLERAGLASAMIEGREGLGYRITWRVAPLAPDPK